MKGAGSQPLRHKMYERLCGWSHGQEVIARVLAYEHEVVLLLGCEPHRFDIVLAVNHLKSVSQTKEEQ